MNLLLIPLPEITLLAVACGVLVLDLFLPDRQRGWTYFLAQCGLVAAIAGVLLFPGLDSQELFSGSYVRDPLSDLAKIFLFLTVALTLVYGKGYLRQRGQFSGEYLALTLFATLGMSVMVSAHGFLTLYLGLELLALSLYTLAALDRDSPLAAEAAMKYFVLGSLASGFLLYGISLFYGITGSLDFGQVAQMLQQKEEGHAVAIFALVFVVAGVAFKFGAVPFHVWVPDLYQGTPTSVALLVGSAPKIAALVMAVRILGGGLAPLSSHWQAMLTLIVVLSMGFGNLLAIAQTNIKRMLAYSAMSHVGFILLGLLALSTEGQGAALFYAVIYALTAAAGFGLLMILSRQGFEVETLAHLKGLNNRSPWYAAMMLLVMFSLAGVPPLVGFYAKLAVLQAALQANLIGLSLVAVLFSVVGLYYYLRVVKLMYFDQDEDTSHLPLTACTDVRLAVGFNALLLLALGISPGGLLGYCLSNNTLKPSAAKSCPISGSRNNSFGSAAAGSGASNSRMRCYRLPAGMAAS
ncbi:NADH-quinone oxidoreductase subunit N [Gammaproteobacteria bacterium]